MGTSQNTCVCMVILMTHHHSDMVAGNGDQGARKGSEVVDDVDKVEEREGEDLQKVGKP